MKIIVQVSLEHGTMFLHDPYVEVEIPADTGASAFTYTENCVCFHVTHYLDGDTNVVISEEAFALDRKPNFSREVPTPNGYIALTDVPVNYYGALRVKQDTSMVNIWNYKENGQEKTWIQVTNLDVF